MTEEEANAILAKYLRIDQGMRPISELLNGFTKGGLQNLAHEKTHRLARKGVADVPLCVKIEWMNCK